MITKLLGGRSADPYPFMAGLTRFNSELFRAEHLLIDNPGGCIRRRTQKFGESLKSFVTGRTHHCRAKYREPLALAPFWRISLSCNDDAESLMAIPPLDESLQDKVILLRAFMHRMPMPTTSLEQWQAFRQVLYAELPRFLHYLLHTFRIPDGLRCRRYGITGFHHPELVALLRAPGQPQKR